MFPQSTVCLVSGDVLIHTGDFSNTGEPEQIEDLHVWLCSQPHKWKIVIAGNHDVTMDAAYYKDRGAARFHADREEAVDPERVRAILINSEHVVYLEDEAVEIDWPGIDRTLKVCTLPHLVHQTLVANTRLVFALNNRLRLPVLAIAEYWLHILFPIAEYWLHALMLYC